MSGTRDALGTTTTIIFDGPDLIWRGKTTSHRRQPTILRMTSAAAEVHVFWRANERDPFTYAGLGKAVEVTDETPVRVRWQFANAQASSNKDTRSQERLPTETLEKITPEHIWNAVQMLLDGYTDHNFAASTDYDLIAEGDVRLPLKAVFGVAGKLALGFDLFPKHFTAGESSVCFRLLREAGFRILTKDESLPVAPPPSLSIEDQEWSEGRARLLEHVVKERARGLSQAKKSQFRREHGKLYCERCGLDPVATYESSLAEACIEVHHHDVQVQHMTEQHRTRLASLQCLCANCHRFVHALMRDQVASFSDMQ